MKLLIALALVSAQSPDCREASARYRSTVTDVQLAAARYSRCLNGASALDDCHDEFRALRSAQQEFEDAVSDVGSYCRQ